MELQASLLFPQEPVTSPNFGSDDSDHIILLLQVPFSTLLSCPCQHLTCVLFPSHFLTQTLYVLQSSGTTLSFNPCIIPANESEDYDWVGSTPVLRSGHMRLQTEVSYPDWEFFITSHSSCYSKCLSSTSN